MNWKFLTLLLIWLSLYSCQKEKIQMVLVWPVESLKEVKITNGRLHFPSIEAFYKTEIAINQKEPVDLADWHRQSDFVSMEMLFLEMQEAFSTVKEEAAYRRFRIHYEDYLFITADQSLSIYGYDPFVSQLLNTKGEVYIGASLVKYTNRHIITILDGSDAKLQWAIRHLKSDQDRGIKIETRPSIIDNSAARSCNPTFIQRTCYGDDWHRVKSSFNLDNRYDRDYFLVRVANLDVAFNSTFKVSIQNEVKGFLGFWYLGRTTINWSVGWGASTLKPQNPIINHGTGWTVYGLSKISYSYALIPPNYPWIIPYNDLRINMFTFDYCTSSISTPHFSCNRTCQ